MRARQLSLGERDALGAADVDPAAGVDDAAELALGEERVPDRVEGEDASGKPASAAGSMIWAPA